MIGKNALFNNYTLICLQRENPLICHNNIIDWSKVGGETVAHFRKLNN